MTFNTASDCRWRVYSWSDLVFDKEPVKLSAGAAAACLMEEEIPPLSPKETQQTAKAWTRQPNRTRSSTPTETSCSDLKGSARPPDDRLDPGDPSFHRQSSKMFTRAVDHCDMSRGPTPDSWDCYLSAQPQRIPRSFWLSVWLVPIHHMMHIWYGWSRGESHFAPSTLLVEYKMKTASGELQHDWKHRPQKSLL